MQVISSPKTEALWSDLVSGKPAAAGTRAYFRSRNRNRIYDFVLGKFQEQASKGLTQAELARRIGARSEVVNRYLAGPRNWTLDTLSDLLLGISGEEIRPDAQSVVDRTPQNRTALDLLEEQPRRDPDTKASGANKAVQLPDNPTKVKTEARAAA